MVKQPPLQVSPVVYTHHAASLADIQCGSCLIHFCQKHHAVYM